MIARKHPWLSLSLLTLWGLALCHWLLFGTWGLNVVCLYGLGALLWLGLSGPTAKGWLWLLIGCGYSLSFSLLDHWLLSPLLALGIPLCFIAWALGGLPRSGWQALVDLFPFQFSGAAFSLLGGCLRQKQKLGRIALGVGLALPILLVAALLLASAEEAFGSLFTRLFTGFGEEFPVLAIKLFFALIIALYSFCLMLRSAQPPQVAAAARPKGDSLVVSVMLGLLCALYLVFLAVSCQVLPHLINAQAATLSRYARQGFFELCAAAMLNLGVFLAVNRFEGVQKGWPRILSLFLAALTLLLIALAGLKMGLYIRLCGLTLMRFYTACFMGVLALFFIALMVSLFRPFPVIRLGAVMLAASLFVLGLTNAEGFIAHSNVDRYLSGDLPTLDLVQYRQFPYAAAPALLRAYEETEDPALKAALLSFLQSQAAPSSKPLWESNRQARQAQALLAPFQP
ncbi:MAG: DUF4173 domain-containing protein [Clostridia bacterium]|nr:DUF4173 domain-containing protein [Clostridia bacterium]